MKFLSSISVSWVDIAVVIVLLVGLARGRSRGMSSELLDVIKWVVIVAAAGFAYQPGGQLLSQQSMFSLLACYMAVYMLVIIGVTILFSMLRKGLGEKIVGSDLFGGAEYYLGMVSGLFRYACVLVVVLAFLGARHFSAEEVKAREKFQQDHYGDIRFPTLYSLQAEVFQMPAERFAEHARLRAEAMTIRDDKAEADGVSEVDWQHIDELLRGSWQSLWKAVNN